MLYSIGNFLCNWIETYSLAYSNKTETLPYVIFYSYKTVYWMQYFKNVVKFLY